MNTTFTPTQDDLLSLTLNTIGSVIRSNKLEKWDPIFRFVCLYGTDTNQITRGLIFTGAAGFSYKYEINEANQGNRTFKR